MRKSIIPVIIAYICSISIPIRTYTNFNISIFYISHSRRSHAVCSFF